MLCYFLPNVITCLSSVSALLSVYFAYRWHTRAFAYFLLLSGILDALDGPLARLLNARSRFGNIYDSMSDLLAFGVAPAGCFLLLKLIHPVIALFYILAIQFRLTRYSSMSEDAASETFFHGMSSPDCVYAATLVGLLPYSNFNWGFALASLLAIYPGKLVPKGYRVIKTLIAVVALFLFLRQG